MSAPAVRAYTYPGLVLIDGTTPLEFEWTGSTTAEQQVVLINNKDGFMAETAYGLRLGALARVFGSGAAPVASGMQVLDSRFVRARVIGGYNDLVATPTTAKGLGHDSQLRLPNAIPNDKGVILGLVVAGGISTATAHVEVILGLDGPEGQAVSDGFTESAGPDGIRFGIGDSAFSGTFVCADVVQDPAGASEFVQIQEVVTTITGGVYARAQQLVELDQDDGSSVALSAGEAYYALLTVPANGTYNDVTVTKGDLATTPLDVTDEPTPPTDEEVIARVEVPYDAGGGAITDADIDNRWALSGFSVSFDGLAALVSAGEARVDNTLTRLAYQGSTLLEDDTAGQSVYLYRDRTLGTTFVERAYLLRSGITTASGAVTVPGVDRRTFTDVFSVDLPMLWSTPIADEDKSWCGSNPHNRSLWLLPLGPVDLSVSGLGSGNTEGAIIVDIERSSPTTISWESLFPSSGTRDLRPRFVYDQTTAKLYAATEREDGAGATVTITRASTTATVAHTAHGHATGDRVLIADAVETAYNGAHTITVTGVDAYTFQVQGSPATPATGTITSTLLAWIEAFPEIREIPAGWLVRGRVDVETLNGTGPEAITGRLRCALG